MSLIVLWSKSTKYIISRFPLPLHNTNQTQSRLSRRGRTTERRTSDVSFLGTYNMLGLAKRCKARFLLASTSEIYGDPEQHPQTELYWGHVNPIGPRSCYDEGKRIAETLTYEYVRQGHVSARVARIFNTFGPRQS